jgi:hypothetical protein
VEEEKKKIGKPIRSLEEDFVADTGSELATS